MKGIQGTSNKTYRQLMGNGLRYEIPKFQRDYTWDAENWDDLWQDIRALITNEDNEPYSVNTTASWPFPCKVISCPGKIERKLSSSGAPR